MRINLKKVSRKIYGYGKQKALPVLLATTLAVNSALAGMPVFNVAEALTHYSNGFELNTDGWFVEDVGVISRVSSGSAEGVVSADGNYHATVVGYVYTNFGGYESVFPTSGYSTSIDVYLDTTK